MRVTTLSLVFEATLFVLKLLAKFMREVDYRAELAVTLLESRVDLFLILVP